GREEAEEATRRRQRPARRTGRRRTEAADRSVRRGSPREPGDRPGGCRAARCGEGSAPEAGRRPAGAFTRADRRYPQGQEWERAGVAEGRGAGRRQAQELLGRAAGGRQLLTRLPREAPQPRGASSSLSTDLISCALHSRLEGLFALR